MKAKSFGFIGGGRITANLSGNFDETPRQAKRSVNQG
jgi:hypothetical protein